MCHPFFPGSSSSDAFLFVDALNTFNLFLRPMGLIVVDPFTGPLIQGITGNQTFRNPGQHVNLSGEAGEDLPRS